VKSYFFTYGFLGVVDREVLYTSRIYMTHFPNDMRLLMCERLNLFLLLWGG